MSPRDLEMLAMARHPFPKQTFVESCFEPRLGGEPWLKARWQEMCCFSE